MKNDEVLQGVKEEMNILHTIKSKMLKWIDHILCRNSLSTLLIKERHKSEDKEEDISSY